MEKIPLRTGSTFRQDVSSNSMVTEAIEGTPASFYLSPDGGSPEQHEHLTGTRGKVSRINHYPNMLADFD